MEVVLRGFSAVGGSGLRFVSWEYLSGMLDQASEDPRF